MNAELEDLRSEAKQLGILVKNMHKYDTHEQKSKLRKAIKSAKNDERKTMVNSAKKADREQAAAERMRDSTTTTTKKGDASLESPTSDSESWRTSDGTTTRGHECDDQSSAARRKRGGKRVAAQKKRRAEGMLAEYQRREEARRAEVRVAKEVKEAKELITASKKRNREASEKTRLDDDDGALHSNESGGGDAAVVNIDDSDDLPDEWDVDNSSNVDDSGSAELGDSGDGVPTSTSPLVPPLITSTRVPSNSSVFPAPFENMVGSIHAAPFIPASIVDSSPTAPVLPAQVTTIREPALTMPMAPVLVATLASMQKQAHAQKKKAIHSHKEVKCQGQGLLIPSASLSTVICTPSDAPSGGATRMQKARVTPRRDEYKEHPQSVFVPTRQPTTPQWKTIALASSSSATPRNTSPSVSSNTSPHVNFTPSPPSPTLQTRTFSTANPFHASQSMCEWEMIRMALFKSGQRESELASELATLYARANEVTRELERVRVEKITCVESMNAHVKRVMSVRQALEESSERARVSAWGKTWTHQIPTMHSTRAHSPVMLNQASMQQRIAKSQVRLNQGQGYRQWTGV